MKLKSRNFVLLVQFDDDDDDDDDGGGGLNSEFFRSERVLWGAIDRNKYRNKFIAERAGELNINFVTLVCLRKFVVKA